MKCFVDKIEFWTFTCSGCGVMWAATVDYIMARQDDHKTFYCPNKCARHYPQKTDEEKLQDELGKTKKRLDAEILCCIEANDQANALERSLRTTKGHLTRMKNQAKEE